VNHLASRLSCELKAPATRPPPRESEQSQELLATDTGRFDDRSERPSGQVAGVHRHDHAMPMVRVTEDVVASPDSIELPAALLKRSHRLPRRHRG